MTEELSNLSRLHSLSSAACDDLASAEEWRELEALMADDEVARSWYLDYCRVHVDLYSAIGGQESLQAIMMKVRAETIPAPATFVPLVYGNGFSDWVGTQFSGWPAAYLIAAVIFAVGAVIGSVTYVSQPGQVAATAEPRDVPRAAHAAAIGRITAMSNCKWAEGSRSNVQGSRPSQSLVCLGEQFNLASGLLEITYDTGAKLILQGPIRFETESGNGGFLSVGKLTGKVEVATAKGFSVRTPTAVVTDLGTEFGVDVDEHGNTVSRVFRGSVRLQMLDSEGHPKTNATILRENESARVGNHIEVLGLSEMTNNFVREIPRKTLSSLDLADVVAGGNGFSGQRNRGIDPSTGRVMNRLPTSPKDLQLTGDGVYHPVNDLPLVDGVFIPNGVHGPVQVDSAGHTFSGFRATDNRTYGGIWAGNVKPSIYAPACNRLCGIDYDSPGHVLLDMLANKGITFDLDSIRRANPGGKLLRFRAVVGNTAPTSVQNAHEASDAWVIIDGVSKFNRGKLYGWKGAIPVLVPIADNDHFLTLATTDGGDGCAWDWLIFGDPRIDVQGIANDSSKAQEVIPPTIAAESPQIQDTRLAQMTFDANGEMIENLTGGAPCSFGSPWSLGYRSPTGGDGGSGNADLQPFTGEEHLVFGESPICGWQRSAIVLGAIVNASDSDFQNVNGIIFEGNIICLHPGNDGSAMVLRWTAPRSGTVRTSTVFTAIDKTTTDVHVLLSHQGAVRSLFDGEINAQADPKTTRLDASQAAVAVSASDCIEVVVGRGSNQTNNSDSTGVRHSIEYIAEAGAN